MRRETTAEWIEEQVNGVLRSYPKDDVDRAIPLLLMLMARDFGFQNLRPDIQAAVCRVATKMGLVEGMDEDEAKAKTVIYIHNLRINTDLLKDIKQIFDTHYAVRAESSAEGFSKVLRPRTARLTPSVAAKVARSDDSIMSAELLRRATGMIRS